ncbi:hypothetical protein [Clostridium cochlearium]|uniref:hypothetical protein n=1 Tax=Clostridium cochlearium TaxID=1494 RepID=UPI00241F7B0B|nr:hypothetical protein [Clostridium cochlearium]MBE6065917.1 hypothetical protein [Clostridium cochlearium]
MVDKLKEILVSLIEWGMEQMIKMPQDITYLISQNYSDSISNNIISQLIPIGITIMVLFFLIDFNAKCINPEWITLQNIFMYFLKVIIFKTVLTSASSVMDFIYKISTDIFLSVSGTAYIDNFDISSITEQINNIDSGITGIFVMLAYFVAVGLMTLVIIFSLVMVRIIIFGRIIEIVLLKAVAPIALSTLVSDGFSNIGKKFLQSYAAVCLQSSVIALSSIIVTSLTGAILGSNIGGSTWEQLLGYCTVILCYVMVLSKSGTISKSIMGL